jgi:hypothetical protein
VSDALPLQPKEQDRTWTLDEDCGCRQCNNPAPLDWRLIQAVIDLEKLIMYRLNQSSVERLPHTGVFASAVRALWRLGHYNYRGYTPSEHKPSASTNFEATYSVLFANVDAAYVQIPMLSQLQMTDYAGIRPVFGPITAETGVAYYSYPRSVIDTSLFRIDGRKFCKLSDLVKSYWR